MQEGRLFAVQPLGWVETEERRGGDENGVSSRVEGKGENVMKKEAEMDGVDLNPTSYILEMG